MEHQAGIIRVLVAESEVDPLAAIWTGGFDVAVDS